MNTLCGILIVSLHFSYTFGVEVSGPPATTYINQGGTAVLSCFVTNHTNETVTWSKIIGGNPTEYFQIGPGGAVTDGDGRLALSDLSDYSVVVDPVDSTDYWANMTIATVNTDDLGQYSCYMGSYGDEADVGELLLDAEPEPATSVAVMNATDTTLTVTWVEGRNGGHPQTFIVEYRVVGSGDDTWMDSEKVDQPPVTLTGLQPLTQYEIRVRSSNTLGSVLSESLFFPSYTIDSTTDPGIVGGLDNTPIIIGVCVGGGLLVVIIILAVLMIFRSKRGKDEPKVELEMRQHGANNAAFVNDYSPPEDPRKSIYAEVVKNGVDKPKKSNGTTTSSFYSEEAEEAPQVPPPFIREGEELVEYENALGKRSLNQGNPFPKDSPYEITAQPLEEKRRDPDGLVYADLDLQTPPKVISGGQPKPQNGETSYASIDFSQRPKSNGTLAQAAL